MKYVAANHLMMLLQILGNYLTIEIIFLKNGEYHHKTLEQQHGAGRDSSNLYNSTPFRIWFYEACIIWQDGMGGSWSNQGQIQL